jgi:hypothetical protein
MGVLLRLCRISAFSTDNNERKVMQFRIRSASGALVLLSGLPAMAQEAALTTARCASCPPATPAVSIPNDPTFLVAGFVIGLVVGIVAAKAFGNKKQQQ